MYTLRGGGWPVAEPMRRLELPHYSYLSPAKLGLGLSLAIGICNCPGRVLDKDLDYFLSHNRLRMCKKTENMTSVLENTEKLPEAELMIAWLSSSLFDKSIEFIIIKSFQISFGDLTKFS